MKSSPRSVDFSCAGIATENGQRFTKIAFPWKLKRKIISCKTKMPLNLNNRKCTWFWDYLMPFTKFWGIFTSIVLCGVGVDIFVHRHVTGLYIILATLGLFFLEITWVITLFLKVCIHDEYSRVFSCWDGILWVREWRKTIIYVAFALGLLLKPHHLWLSSVAGIMLIILGILHFLHHWGDASNGYSMDLLLDNQDNYLHRFENSDGENSVAGKDVTTGEILNNES